MHKTEAPMFLNENLAEEARAFTRRAFSRRAFSEIEELRTLYADKKNMVVVSAIDSELEAIELWQIAARQPLHRAIKVLGLIFIFAVTLAAAIYIDQWFWSTFTQG